MFNEEKIINGILHWRGVPGGEWHAYSLEQLTRKITDMKSYFNEQNEDLDYNYFKSVLKSDRIARIIERSVSKNSAIHDLMMVYCLNHNEAIFMYDQHCGATC
jgi:hypothetical protein